jgi:hypothetical protein
MVGWTLFIFGIPEFIHHRLMPGEYKYFGSKNMALHMGLKIK